MGFLASSTPQGKNDLLFLFSCPPFCVRSGKERCRLYDWQRSCAVDGCFVRAEKVSGMEMLSLEAFSRLMALRFLSGQRLDAVQKEHKRFPGWPVPIETLSRLEALILVRELFSHPLPGVCLFPKASKGGDNCDYRHQAGQQSGQQLPGKTKQHRGRGGREKKKELERAVRPPAPACLLFKALKQSKNLLKIRLCLLVRGCGLFLTRDMHDNFSASAYLDSAKFLELLQQFSVNRRNLRLSVLSRW